MDITIWPKKPATGGICLDLRDVLQDGTLRPAVVCVDPVTGKELTLGQVFQFRDGGGHAEIFRMLVDSTIPFDRDGEQVKIH